MRREFLIFYYWGHIILFQTGSWRPAATIFTVDSQLLLKSYLAKLHRIDHMNLNDFTLIYVSLLVKDVWFSKPWMFKTQILCLDEKFFKNSFYFALYYFFNCITVFYCDLFRFLKYL